MFLDGLATVFQIRQGEHLMRLTKTFTAILTLVVLFATPIIAVADQGVAKKKAGVEQRSTVERLKNLTDSVVRKTVAKPVSFESRTNTWFMNAGFAIQNGCEQTYTNIYAEDAAWHIHGEKPVRTQSVQVSIERYDTCNETQISFSWGWAVPEIFTFKGENPNVKGVVSVCDSNDKCQDVFLDIYFEFLDGTHKWNYQNDDNSKAFSSSSLRRGLSQNARAFGTVEGNYGKNYMGPDQYAVVGSGTDTFQYSEKRKK